MKDYKLKYHLKAEAGNFTTANIEDEEFDGLTDALFFASILTGDGRSYMFFSLDGENKSELPPIEVFKMWATLGARLSEELEPKYKWQKEACNDIMQKVRQHVLFASEKVEG